MRYLLLLLALMTLEASEPNTVNNRLSTADGALSFELPQGWLTREMPGMKNYLAFGAPAQGFAPNINIVDEQAKMTLEQYQAACLAGMTKIMPDFKLAENAEFVTAAGVSGRRLVVTNTQGQIALRQVFFLLSGRDPIKFVVTCSALAADGETHDLEFDAAAQSILIK